MLENAENWSAITETGSLETALSGGTADAEVLHHNRNAVINSPAIFRLRLIHTPQ